MASKFYLMNEKEERWGLNSASEGFFVDPKGFGIAYDADFLKVGDKWVSDHRELKQPTPSGKIQFPINQYKTFQDFLKFINSAKELRLVYMPSGVYTEYFADIDVVKLDKGGYTLGKVFEVPVSFACKSLFYTSENLEYHVERADGELRWDFTWDSKFNDAEKIYFTFDNTGDVESPFVLSFTGYCTNPVITVYVDGQTIHELKLNIVLEASDKLEISMHDDDLYITVNGENRNDCLDFTAENFFKLPVGESQIYFRSETGRANNIVIRLAKYYKAV